MMNIIKDLEFKRIKIKIYYLDIWVDYQSRWILFSIWWLDIEINYP